MAEEKQETTNKPLVELNVWFIVCLVILIISTLLVMKLSHEKADLKDQLAATTTQLDDALERERVLREAAKAMQTNIKSNPGSYSMQDVTKMLEDFLNDAGIDATVNPTTGEITTNVAESGEVTK